MASDTVLRQIPLGHFDESLEDLEAAIKLRLTEVRSSRTNKSYGIGDRVVINNYCGTKYLHGKTAVVVGKNRTKVTIRLEHPVGRFVRYNKDGSTTSVDINVPPSIVDLVK